MESSLSAFSLFPGAFGTFFVGFAALAIVLAVIGRRRERERQVQLQAYAAQLGWHPIVTAVPGPVSKAVSSHRTKLALGTRRGEFDMWVVWHRWTESTGGENSTTRTRNLTRYFLWLGPAYPDV